jgi:hypothetical protein
MSGWAAAAFGFRRDLRAKARQIEPDRAQGSCEAANEAEQARKTLRQLSQMLHDAVKAKDAQQAPTLGAIAVPASRFLRETIRRSSASIGVTLHRTSSRIALSNPSSVSGYIRPPTSCCIMRIDCV